MEFYIIYWCHNINNSAHYTFVGIKFDCTIKEVNKICKNIVTKTNETEPFIIKKYTVINDFMPSNVPKHENDYFDIIESRYIEVHTDGKINVIHKRRFFYV